MTTEREVHIQVDLAQQELRLLSGHRLLRHYRVSTACNGSGEHMNTGCTPRGQHRIRLCIGAGCPENTVFIGRRPTGETYNPALAAQYPERDWILTRILWLTGLEPGRNRGGNVDTLRRFIYIHGCPDSEPMGLPKSHGCIRMRNEDLLDLFDRVHNGTRVFIQEGRAF